MAHYIIVAPRPGLSRTARNYFAVKEGLPPWPHTRVVLKSEGLATIRRPPPDDLW